MHDFSQKEEATFFVGLCNPRCYTTTRQQTNRCNSATDPWLWHNTCRIPFIAI